MTKVAVHAGLSPFRRERGVALIMVLWVLALLTVMAGNYSYSTRVNTTSVRNGLDSVRARYLAETGVRRALYALAEPDPKLRWAIDGTERTWSTAEGVLHVELRDEAGLIDVNRAELELLDGLFRVVGLERERRRGIVDAIGDWRDPDSVRRPYGAEDADYAAIERVYGAKDGPFDSVAELRFLPGITAVDFQKVEPYLTVHGGRSKVNPRVAPREVLLAMPKVGPGTIASRRAPNAAADTGLTSGAVKGSGTFRISVRAELASGAIFSLRTVIRLSAGPTPRFSVLRWEENV